ncbi:MAG TPA: ABC transporter substrate-binding protein [Methylomirabilota bacterium]|nr:ABC transporter substrate-binding protein [Methylomirabilota bacterium]
MMTRRQVLRGLSVMSGAGLIGVSYRPTAAEAPPETPRVRLAAIPGICVAPQYVAEELLRAEGFTDVEYVPGPATYQNFAAGTVDISMAFVAPFIIQVDTGVPIVMLAGVHPGCFELIATERVRAITDLKGKTVGVLSMGGAHHVFLASMAAYVGLDPAKDINWFTHHPSESARLLAEGRVDALMAFPPVPQELRAKNVGRIVVNSALDRPWSQYFCCVVTARSEFVRSHPMATRRALRAILKATDVCALQPDRAAQRLVQRGFTKEYDYALQTMKEVPYNRWRAYNPEDAVRFYALRLHEIGMVKSSPQTIIAQGTDWRFLNALKKELKG